MHNEIKEEYGLSAKEMSDSHICRDCVAFRPAENTMVCNGFQITMPAYCAFMKTEFCLGKKCKEYKGV